MWSGIRYLSQLVKRGGPRLRIFSSDTTEETDLPRSTSSIKTVELCVDLSRTRTRLRNSRDSTISLAMERCVASVSGSIRNLRNSLLAGQPVESTLNSLFLVNTMEETETIYDAEIPKETFENVEEKLEKIDPSRNYSKKHITRQAFYLAEFLLETRIKEVNADVDEARRKLQELEEVLED